MYERESLPRVSEVKAVSRPVRQQPAVTGAQAAPASSDVEATTVAGQNAGQQQAAQQAAAQAVDPRELQETVSQLNSYAQNLNRALQFRVDKDSGETVVRVLDAQTDEVIRQIPSEDLLTIASRMRAASDVSGKSGLLIQEKV